MCEGHVAAALSDDVLSRGVSKDRGRAVAVSAEPSLWRCAARSAERGSVAVAAWQRGTGELLVANCWRGLKDAITPANTQGTYTYQVSSAVMGEPSWQQTPGSRSRTPLCLSEREERIGGVQARLR